jgi:hypothetical protein
MGIRHGAVTGPSYPKGLSAYVRVKAEVVFVEMKVHWEILYRLQNEVPE